MYVHSSLRLGVLTIALENNSPYGKVIFKLLKSLIFIFSFLFFLGFRCLDLNGSADSRDHDASELS